MRIYTKEIPGTKNDYNEDSYFTTVFEYAGTEFSLAIVADGCSGYNGSKASHTAVHDLGHNIREKIVSGVQDYETLIRSSVDVVNGELHKMSMTRTTLDLLLLTPNYGCLAHAGDSRIYAHTSQGLMKVTEDDLANGEPSNYLGAYYIGNSSLQDRLSVRVFSEQDLASINGFLLATDGLWSRVPENFFLSLFANSTHINSLFDSIDKEVYLPNLKIKELSEARIKAEFGAIFTSLDLSVNIPVAELSEQLYSLYVGRNAEIVKRVDKKVIPFDDTTLVYVDRFNVVDSLFQERSQMKDTIIPGLEDKIGKLQQELDVVTGNLSQRDVEVEAMKAEFDQDKRGLDLRYNQLQEQYGTLGGNYTQACAQRDELSAEKERLTEERDRLIVDKQTHEQKGSITNQFMSKVSELISPYLTDKSKQNK